MQKLLLKDHDEVRDEYVKKWSADVAKEYKESYEEFLKSIDNPALDEQVDEYLSNLSKDHLHEQGEKKVMEKLIELAESEFDDVLNE